MNFKKLVKAQDSTDPKLLAALHSNKYLRDFEVSVWSAFNDLESNLVFEFKLDNLRPFMEKLQKEVDDYIGSLDPKIKKEIARLLKERQNRYK